MNIKALLSNGKALKKSYDLNAMNGMIKDKWTTAVFDLSKIKADINPDGKLVQFRLLPYGYSRDPKNMHPGEMMYIGDITFWKGQPEIEYPPEKPAGVPVIEKPSSEGPLVFKIDYGTACQGIVDGKKTAALTKKHTEDEKSCVKVVPNTVDPQKTNINLDCFSINYSASQLKDAKFITVKYKYVCPDGAEGQNAPMWLSILSNGGAVKETIEFKAVTPLN